MKILKNRGENNINTDIQIGMKVDSSLEMKQARKW